MTWATDALTGLSHSETSTTLKINDGLYGCAQINVEMLSNIPIVTVFIV